MPAHVVEPIDWEIGDARAYLARQASASMLCVVVLLRRGTPSDSMSLDDDVVSASDTFSLDLHLPAVDVNYVATVSPLITIQRTHLRLSFSRRALPLVDALAIHSRC